MGELHDLLGISASASTGELKREYEQAMARASRALDHQRALALSAAFDRLSPEQRGKIFGRTVGRFEPSLDQPTRGRTSPPGWDSSNGPASNGRLPRRGKHSGLARRILVGTAVVSIVALLAGWLWAQRVASVPAAPLSPPDRQSVATVSVSVPVDAPVDRDGFVTVSCSPAAVGSDYDFRARPGETVSCRNGATPQWGP